MTNCLWHASGLSAEKNDTTSCSGYWVVEKALSLIVKGSSMFKPHYNPSSPIPAPTRSETNFFQQAKGKW